MFLLILMNTASKEFGRMVKEYRRIAKERGVKTKNPYVPLAEIFLRQRDKDYFVIAYLQMSLDHRSMHSNPEFLHDKSLGAKPIRLRGCEEVYDETFQVNLLYHAENKRQAKKIIRLLSKGKGYSVGGIPTCFEVKKRKIPGGLEILADELIEKYENPDF